LAIRPLTSALSALLGQPGQIQPAWSSSSRAGSRRSAAHR